MKKYIISVCLTISIFFPFSLRGEELSFKITRNYLNIPVSRSPGVERGKMVIEIDGKQESEMMLRLVDSKPDLWVYYDVSSFKGKTVKIYYSGKSGGLTKIYQDDVINGQDSLYKEQYRPQYHFSARRGEINDACGLVYYDGEYHLFYGQDPYDWDGFPDNKVWGHAVSKDLIHWEELPTAIKGGKFGNPWSGSAVIDYNNTAGFNKENTPAMIAMYSACSLESGQSFECISYSLDKGRTFKSYDGNPVIDPKKMWGVDGKTLWYNDPTRMFWHEATKKWVMVMMVHDGFSILTSGNLKDWHLESHTAGFFECPQLFELPVDGNKNNTKWVMYGASGVYVIGDFDGKKFTPETGRFSYCGGAQYAGQVYNDIPASDGRCIQIMWGTISHKEMPFNGMMLLPTSLELRTTRNGIRIFSTPVKEIENLQEKEYSWESLPPKKAIEVLQQFQGIDCLRVNMTVKLGHATDFQFSLFGQNIIRYYMRDSKINMVDFYTPEDPTSMELTMDIFLDRSSVEVFIDGGAFNYAMKRESHSGNTSFYNWEDRGGDIANNLEIKSLKVYPMKSIWEGKLRSSVPQKDKQKEEYPAWALGPFTKREKPILEPSYSSVFHCPIVNREVHWEAQNVYNPAAVVKDGKVWILYRADDAPRPGGWGRTCRIGLAYSNDGINFIRQPEPVLYPNKDNNQSIEWEGGIEDIHIIEGENGVYYVNYTAWTGSHDEICTASSKDLIHWVKHGPAFEKSGKKGSADHRTGVILSQLVGEKLLPVKLNGKYRMYYTHPCAIATSDDLINWEPTGEAVFKAGGEVPGHSRSHESGAIALLREEGILLMVNACSDLYGRQAGWYLGQYLLDKNDGKTIIGDPGFSFLYAEKDWEKLGFTGEAIVSNGMVFFKGKWFLYYGAADRCIGVAIYDPKNAKEK